MALDGDQLKEIKGTMNKTNDSCVFTDDKLASISVPLDPVVSTESGPKSHFRDHLFHNDSLLSGIFNPIIKNRHAKLVQEADEWKDKELNLRPGEWVQVRSLDEVRITLNEGGYFNGLAFMSEMEQFCGKKFLVKKRVQKILLESTGEYRKLKTPTIILEGASCDGSSHQGCDRCCPCFWREQWLKRVEK